MENIQIIAYISLSQIRSGLWGLSSLSLPQQRADAPWHNQNARKGSFLVYDIRPHIEMEIQQETFSSTSPNAFLSLKIGRESCSFLNKNFRLSPSSWVWYKRNHKFYISDTTGSKSSPESKNSIRKQRRENASHFLNSFQKRRFDSTLTSCRLQTGPF